MKNACQPHFAGAMMLLQNMKLLEQTLSEAEQVSLVQRIVDSQLFRRSQRLREMLTFIGEQTISKGRSSVREREIGVAIFGRKQDYDTTIDNIVRVNASELRRRLERYFETEGAGEEYVLELPRGGGYALHYYYRLQAGVASHTRSEQSVETPFHEAVYAEQSSVQTDVHREQPVQKLTMRSSWFTAAVLLCLVLGTGCLLLAWQLHSLRSQINPWRDRPQLKAFWGRFFADGQETDIVVGDDSLTMEQELLGRKVSLDQYLSNSYRVRDAEDPTVRKFVDLVHSHNIGGIADFEVVKHILALSPRNAPVRFGSARDYVPEEVRNHNLILVGSRVANPWVDLFKDRLVFSIERDEATNATVIHNREPRPGEQAEYQTNSNDGQSIVYSMIAFIPNLDKNSTALLIGGSDSQGTKAAGDFLTSEQGLKQIADRLHGFPHFEVLLRSSRVAGTTLRTEIVAIRDEH